MWSSINQTTIQDSHVPTVFICLSSFCCPIFQDWPICSILLNWYLLQEVSFQDPKSYTLEWERTLKNPFSSSVSFYGWGSYVLEIRWPPQSQRVRWWQSRNRNPVSDFLSGVPSLFTALSVRLNRCASICDDNDRDGNQSANNCQHLLSACRMPGTLLKCFLRTHSDLRLPLECECHEART